MAQFLCHPFVYTCSQILTLISKKVRVDNIKDYLPISLIGCIYKILAKGLQLDFEGSSLLALASSRGFCFREIDS